VSNDQDPAADPFGIFPEVRRSRQDFPLPDPATLTVGQMLWGYQVAAELTRKRETETSWNVVTADRIDRLNKMFLASPGYWEFSAWANIEIGRAPSLEVAMEFLGRLAKLLRKRFEEIYPLPLLDAVRLLTRPAPSPNDLVTLDQCAAIAGVSKRTLERHKTRGRLPEPAVEGGGGKAARYHWSVMRPWLEAKFGIRLSETFPASRFL
jgi:hypothetical protein